MINNEKLLARLRDYGIKSLKLFGYHTSRSREYNFIFNNIPSKKAMIMDIGSVGSLLPLKLAQEGHKVFTVDTRQYHEKHPNITSINKDINSINFPENFFDEIICVSVLEHIGMSAYGDPSYQDGDKLTVQKFNKILKISGKLLITMPFAGEYKILPWLDTYEKIYDYKTIRKLFNNWEMVKEEFYFPKSSKNWIKTNREISELSHDIYLRSNLACFIFEKLEIHA